MEATIIAVGNGGYNIAIDLINSNVFRNYKMIYIDTSDDIDKIQNKKNENKPIYGEFLPKISSQDVAEYISDLELWEQNINGLYDNFIICAALGGNTGTNLAPLYALASKRRGKYVCSIFSTPFIEGQTRSELDKIATTNMQLISFSDLTIQQNNENLKNIRGHINMPLVDTFRALVQKRFFEDLASMEDEQLKSIIPQNYKSIIAISNQNKM